MKAKSYKELIGLDALGKFKRLARYEAALTRNFACRLGVAEVFESRGESAYIVEIVDRYIALVDEGLGTKNIVADFLYKLTLAKAMEKLTGRTFYDYIARDTIAMIVNDLITCGALPFALMMHLAVGHPDWFDNEARYADFLRGWRYGCQIAGCNWGGGETPVLRDVIYLERSVLAGSAAGQIYPKHHRIMNDVHVGDSIIFLLASGAHANGYTDARNIAKKLKKGYLTLLSDGRTYGEALLDPTVIYVRFIEECQKAGIKIRYAANITGHGWLKMLRHGKKFTHVIDALPKPLPVFDFLKEHGNRTNRYMYTTYNMRVGMALMVRPEDEENILAIREGYEGVISLKGGTVEKALKDGKSRVVIKPLKGLTLHEKELNIG